MNKSELQAMYVNFLREEGYRPEVDKDGDIVFKYEGGTYIVFVDFRIVYPNFYHIGDEVERQKVLRAADYATGSTKVGKVFTVRDRVWGSVELLFSSKEEFRGVFGRAMRILRTAVMSFVEKMRE
jgi:hypothetical protein